MDREDEDSADTMAAGGSLFDVRDRQKVRNYVSFALGSVRRHPLLIAAVFVSIVGATVAALLAFPKTYHVETKALAQTNSALTERGDGPGADSLTRVAADTVLRQDTLLALIKETDLLRYTNEHRAPIQRARDAIVRLVQRHDDSDADQLDAMVRQLEKKLTVWTSDNGSTVTIAIDWTDAPMACRLVDAAQRAFLDARYAREVTALQESIEILNKHTSSLKADIDEAVDGIERMRNGEAPKVSTGSEAPSTHLVMLPRPAAPPHVQGPDPELQELSVELQAKQHAIDEIEDLRRRRVSDLQARMVEARTTLTENHPTIVDLKQSIANQSVESAQVTILRKEAAALKAAYDARDASARDASTSTAVAGAPAPGFVATSIATPPQLSSDVLRVALDLREDRDPAMVYARGQLRDAMDKYAALRAQIQTAQIDLETAQAAFKYRYTIVTPARLPRSPTSPNLPVVILAAIIAGLFCGLVLAILADLRRGRLIERWQIEHLLERPIIGEVVLPEGFEVA
jgi:hypothetical protein